MRTTFSSALICLGALALCGIAADQSDWPRLKYAVDPDWPRLPAGWTFDETPGVAVDAQEHVFVLHRGPHSIMEFDKGGNLVRSWGDGVFVRPAWTQVRRRRQP